MNTEKKVLFGKHHEVGMYLLLGTFTTIVGGVVYYAVLLGGKALFNIPAEEVTGARYLTLYTAAQILQWLCAALFAFYTNRKWVFTDADKSIPVFRQLTTFFGGRVLTLGLDYLITYAMTYALMALFPAWSEVCLLGEDQNLCEILSKLVAAVIVIICNFFISKIFVFKKERKA